MLPTTAEPKARLDSDQRAWLIKMGAALEIRVGEPTVQRNATQRPPQANNAAANAELQAKCKKIKEAVKPKIKDAVAADPSKKEEILRLMKSAVEHESQSDFEHAFAVLKSLVVLVTSALSAQRDLNKCESATTEAMQNEGELVEHDRKGGLRSVIKNRDSLWIHFNNLQEHQGAEAIHKDILELESMFKTLDEAILARDMKAAQAILVGKQAILDGKKRKGGIQAKINAARQKALPHADYVGLLNNNGLQIDTLEAHPNKNAIEFEIDSMKKSMDEAMALKAKNGYPKALSRLLSAATLYGKAQKKADAQGREAFTRQLDIVQRKIEELEKPDRMNSIVACEVAAIKAKLARAERYAGGDQYPQAMKLVAEVRMDCEMAKKHVVQQIAFNSAKKAVEVSTGNFDEDPQAAVEAVQQLHDRLKAHPQELVIRNELGQVQQTINQAKAALA